MRPNRAHCDVWRKNWQVVDDAFPDLEGLIVDKVTAHRSKAAAELLRGQERRDFVGNDLGDAQAKLGAAMSAPSSWVQGHYNDKWDDAIMH